MSDQSRATPAYGKCRRWFLGLEPVFESGRRGKKAAAWDAEDELVRAPERLA